MIRLTNRIIDSAINDILSGFKKLRPLTPEQRFIYDQIKLGIEAVQIYIKTGKVSKEFERWKKR